MDLKASVIYRRKAELLRGQGNECVNPNNRDVFWELASVWDQLAKLAEQRETLECLGEIVENLNGGKRYLTSTE